MARDYGRKPFRKKNSAPKQLFWMLASFLCGYLTATAFDLTSLTTWVNTKFLAKKNPEKPKIKTAAKPVNLPKPKFEFYTLLAKDHGVIAPVTQVAAGQSNKVTANPNPNPPPQPTPASTLHQPAQTAKAVIPAAPKPHLQLESKSNVAKKESYLIQVASFKSRADAEHMKAMLTLKGFDVSVTATVQQQINWYRVIVGPFESRAEAERTQLTLVKNERLRGMIRKLNA